MVSSVSHLSKERELLLQKDGGEDGAVASSSVEVQLMLKTQGSPNNHAQSAEGSDQDRRGERVRLALL